MDNLAYWRMAKQPDLFFLKPIAGGKLTGKTDINPQWRLMAITQMFGMVGVGWYYDVKRTWEVTNPNTGELMCFAEVLLYVFDKEKGDWSKPINGIGGSMLIEKNKNGLQSNDDGYKMAVTDALSVAFKQIGIASDIYLGNFRDSKYSYNINEAYQSEQEEQALPPIAQERFLKALELVKKGEYLAENILSKFSLTAEQYAMLVNL